MHTGDRYGYMGSTPFNMHSSGSAPNFVQNPNQQKQVVSNMQPTQFGRTTNMPNNMGTMGNMSQDNHYMAAGQSGLNRSGYGVPGNNMSQGNAGGMNIGMYQAQMVRSQSDNGGIPFDTSNFPILGSSNTGRFPSAPQQSMQMSNMQQQQQQQQRDELFSIHGEDFPALPGSQPKSSPQMGMGMGMGVSEQSGNAQQGVGGMSSVGGMNHGMGMGLGDRLRDQSLGMYSDGMQRQVQPGHNQTPQQQQSNPSLQMSVGGVNQGMSQASGQAQQGQGQNISGIQSPARSPSLSGVPNPPAGSGPSQGQGQGQGMPGQASPMGLGMGMSMGMGSNGGGMGLAMALGGLNVSGLQQIRQELGPGGTQSAQSGVRPTTVGITDQNKENRFGLIGLLDVIRATDRDMSTLAAGSDLTTFGLNLNSSECLYSSFSSPFAESPANPEPQYSTPACYLMHPPTLKAEHLGKFQLETLFYMFYSVPRDILQACAAQELYRREWRFHSELRLWLKPRSPQELMQGHPSVQFVYFDVNSWEPRLFTSNFRGNIAAGLLSDDDVRVKIQQTVPPTPSGGA